MGSKIGGLFSIMLGISLTMYFTYLSRRMYRGVDDNIQSLVKSNDLDDGNN